MNHADIQKHIRDRIAEIDRTTNGLAEERGKLQAMLDGARVSAPVAAPQPFFVPYPVPYPPMLRPNVWPWCEQPFITWTTTSADALPLRVGDVTGVVSVLDVIDAARFPGGALSYANLS